MDIFRNILAFGCTFYLIYFITSSVLNMLFVLTCGYTTNVQKQSRYYPWDYSSFSSYSLLLLSCLVFIAGIILSLVQFYGCILECLPRKSPDFPRIFLDFPCIFRKKYPRCGKHRGLWLFFIVCCIFLWEYWWYFVEYKNYRQADHRCHTDSYCSIVMTIHC